MNWHLTPRELEVLDLLKQGASTGEITAALVVSPATTRNHIQNIMRKLGASSRLEAVAIATSKQTLLERAVRGAGAGRCQCRCNVKPAAPMFI